MKDTEETLIRVFLLHDKMKLYNVESVYPHILKKLGGLSYVIF